MTYAVEYFRSDSDIPCILNFKTASEALEFVNKMRSSFKSELEYIFIHCFSVA